MVRAHLRSSALAIALLLASCADLRWHKDGADAAALERDLAECRQQAHFQAERQAVPAMPGSRIIGVDRLGRPVLGQPERIESDRAMIAHDLARHCMDKQGWKLVPVEKR